MRRAFGFCALFGLAFCAAPVGATIEEYDTVSPINMTIDSFEYMNAASQDAFTEAMRHWSVAVYEMTNGRHRLGRVKIVQGGGNREFAHVRWLENYHENGKPHAETKAGAYVPYRQEAISPRHAIKMSSEFLGGRNDFTSDQGPIDTGYTLAHECGHYVYGLFDEYDGSSGVGWFEGWMNPNLPRFGDQLVWIGGDWAHSIMRDQITGFALDGKLFPYERAMALNFSTDEHYGFDGTKCPEEYQTAQRRLYPRTVSCWSTLVSKELPAWALLRSYKRRFYRDLVSAKPTASFDITHKDGFPFTRATEAEFRAKSPAIDDLKIEWGTTRNQRARMILVENSGNLLEFIFGLTWPYTPEVCNLVDMMLTAIPDGADVGVFTFDRDGVHEVVPFRKIADGPNGGGVLPENAIIRDGLSMETQNKLRTLLRPQDTQTGIDIPLYDVLSDAIDRLQAYMDARHILLGDIVVLVAQKPEDSEKHSGKTTFEALGAKSRSFFIPLSFVSLRNRSIELYQRLSRETGGYVRKSSVPLSPERIRYIGNAPWRSFQEEPYLLLNPWNGHLQLLCADDFGDVFSGHSALGTSPPRTVQSNTQWRSPDSVAGEAGPSMPEAMQEKRDAKVRGERLTSSPFLLDSRIGAFSAFINIINPYQRSLQCTLVAPGGKRFPIGGMITGMDNNLNVRVKVKSSQVGYWHLECEGAGYKEVQVSFYIVGESRGLKAGDTLDEAGKRDAVGKDEVSVRQEEEGGRGYRGARFHRLEAAGVSGGIFNSAENGKRLRIQCSTYEGEELLTGLSVVARVIHPAGWSESIHMRDDGVAPDLADRDGIYTGEVLCNEPGHYQVVTTADNDGDAYVTRLSKPNDPGGSFDLEGKSPFWGDAVTEPFRRMDQVTFDVIYDPETARAPDPECAHMTLPILSIGDIEGPQHILEGIETEYSADITPGELGTMMAKYFAWSVDNSDKFRILPDPEGRYNVIRVITDRDYGSSSGRLQVCNAIPPALIRLVEAQRRTLALSVVQPVFAGAGFVQSSHTVFENEDIFFEGTLRLPEGYDSTASWSRRGPDQVARLVRQDATGCTVRTLRPGTFTLTLSSDVYPDRIGRTITVKVIRREGPGSQPGKPGDDAVSKPRPIPGGDPGGDDDVDTDPGDDGDGGSGGGGPGRPGRPPRGPETPDPEEPVPLPPGVSAVLVDGRPLGPGGTALVEGIRSVSLAFRFADAVERHVLSASLLSAGGRRNEAEATIGGARLSADGLALTADFHPRTEGRYRIAYGFERKDGVRATGSFVVKVTGGSGSSDQGDERRGGGCSALDGAVILFLLACFLLPCRAEGAGDRS